MSHHYGQEKPRQVWDGPEVAKPPSGASTRRSVAQGAIPEGVTARDEALRRVSDNAGAFVEDALAWLKGYAELVVIKEAHQLLDEHPRQVTGEALRLMIERAGITPHHPNAWGAFVAVAVRRGILVPTGRWEAMKAKRSHARRTPVYRVEG